MRLSKRRFEGAVLGIVACTLLVACNDKQASNPEARTVAKVAACAAGDKPEPALQGQVPAAVRAEGFQGYNCNLALEGQFSEAATSIGVSFASFKDDHGHYCGYFSGNGGVVAVDITDPANPVKTATLGTKGMQTSGETLRVNAKRQLMVALARENMQTPDSDLDIYDLSADCRDPKVLWAGPLKSEENGGAAVPRPLKGHDGNFTLDGMTFYDGANFTQSYTAIDLTDPTKPKILAQLNMSKQPLATGPSNGLPHGLSLSEDGNRGYFTSLGLPKAKELKDPNFKAANGFYVIDTSEIQARKPDPQTKVISYLSFRNESAAQHTLSVKIGGKPYLIYVTEGGGGGIPAGGGGSPQDACDAGLTPFPLGRIIDIGDETKPKLVSNLTLEVHDLANCSKVMPDIVGEGLFTYGSHNCSVDNRENATALACAYWQSGVRVFDIRDPKNPKEIAYYNPAPTLEGKAPEAQTQSQAQSQGQAPPQPSRVNSCGAPMGFDFDRKLLSTACQRSGLLVLKFENGTWPFKESTPAPRTISYN